jgi:molybdate transport system substrate-binding protein
MNRREQLSRRRALAALTALLPAPLVGGACRSREAERVRLRVAAAADLARAFAELGAAFERDEGARVVFSFGSTGLLSRQIKEGAPFDLLAAANASFVDDLIAHGAALADTRALYARGRLAVWARDGVELPAALAELAAPRFVRVAIANPEHAPYGQAARQALERAGVWGVVSPRLVFGENVQQALQLAQSGNVEAAVVALSLALATGRPHLLVPEALHDPLEQALVVCSRAAQPALARRFAAFVLGERGQATLRRHGFSPPG